MKLSEGKKGKHYRIEEVELTGDKRRRILAMGLTEDTVIFIEDKKIKGPMIIKVRGTRLALGGEFCRKILVGEMEY